uniref:phosphoethanolamine N-methyltransferase n=1 Tax=Heligmosomoides polygyrus TaxID=6339 RepID=A0A8L8KIQ1_HELPZ
LDEFVAAALRALRMDGVMIVRQDLCGDPKKVAKLTDYFDIFRTQENGGSVGFHFYAVNEVEASIYEHQNWHDYIWTLVKKSFPILHGKNITFRDFLDRTQYTDTGIIAYEWIFGDNFISPGGWDQNLEILKRFGRMKTGQKMLDIGVGIGGGARQAASEFGLHVLGVDLSSNMLAVALDRIHREKDSRVTYAICDAVVYDFEPNSFDYVFSRDCIQHIEDTEKLFSRIYRALKPGGKVLITMYGVGHGKLSDSFKEYVAKRQYYLKNLGEIKELANKVGFVDIEVENMTPRFKEILLEERRRVEQNKAEFLKKFSQKEYDSLVSGWNSKLKYIADDNHNWNFLYAVKP